MPKWNSIMNVIERKQGSKNNFKLHFVDIKSKKIRSANLGYHYQTKH